MASGRLRKDGDSDEEDAFASAGNSEASDDEKATTKIENEVNDDKADVPTPEPAVDKTEPDTETKEASEDDKDDKEKETEEDTEKEKGEVDEKAQVPRDKRYFLHDSREDDEGKENEQPEPENDQPKGRGKRFGEGEGPDEPGPWKHDKYFEMLEKEGKKKPGPRGGGKKETWAEDDWEEESWEEAAWSTGKSWQASDTSRRGQARPRDDDGWDEADAWKESSHGWEQSSRGGNNRGGASWDQGYGAQDNSRDRGQNAWKEKAVWDQGDQWGQSWSNTLQRRR